MLAAEDPVTTQQPLHVCTGPLVVARGGLGPVSIPAHLLKARPTATDRSRSRILGCSCATADASLATTTTTTTRPAVCRRPTPTPSRGPPRASSARAGAATAPDSSADQSAKGKPTTIVAPGKRPAISAKSAKLALQPAGTA